MRSVLIVSLLLVGVGCDSGSVTPPDLLVRDSLGVRIVEDLQTTDPASTWRVSPDPLFRVGWNDSGPLFENLAAGVVLGDGRVVVAEMGGSGIYFFDSDGSLQGSFGGSGEGPGEYQRIEALVRMPGDSVLIQDDGNYRGTVLDPNGAFVRDFRLVHWEGFLSNRLLGLSGGNEYFLWPTGYDVDGITEPGWVQGALQKWSPGKTGTDTIFTAGFVGQNGPRDRDPFSDWGFTDGGPGGVLYGRSDRGEISWIDGDGSILQISRWMPNWRQVDDAVWQGYTDAYWARYPKGDPQRVERYLASAREDASETLPLFGLLHSDSEGNAWIAEYEFFVAPPKRYMVILKNGTRSGWVTVPEGLRVLDIGVDRILGIEKDEFDVQAVVVYGIQKGNGGG